MLAQDTRVTEWHPDCLSLDASSPREGGPAGRASESTSCPPISTPGLFVRILFRLGRLAPRAQLRTPPSSGYG